MKYHHRLQTMGDCGYEAIAKYFQKSIQHEVAVLENSDPEDLHKMRVGMRRLRSTLQILAPIIKLPKDGNDAAIRKIAQVLGNVRDLDVLQATLKNKYYPDLLISEQKQLQKILDRLSKKRNTAFKSLVKTLSSSKYRDFKEAYQDWLEFPRYTAIASLPIQLALPDLLLSLISRLLLHPGWLIGTETVEQGLQLSDRDLSYLYANHEVLHDLRKLIKAARYQTEFFADFYGKEYANQVKYLEIAQELLGELHDRFVLLELLSKILKTKVESALPNLFAIVAKSQIATWRDYRSIQANYLNPEFRQHIRSLVMSPPLDISNQSLAALKHD